jgi:competence protein ComGC
MKSERGFTLIEMLIVMLVISVLMFITIPNITKHNSNINKKGCEAYVKMVQAQVQAYQIEESKLPSNVGDLIAAGYLKSGDGKCPDGQSTLSIGTDGTVTSVASTTSQ